MVTITSPKSGAGATDTLAVTASVSSPYSLTSVHAQVETVGVDLTPSWTGNFALTSIAYGAHTLTVTATDVLGGVGTSTVAFTRDGGGPTINVSLPFASSVATSSISLKATCRNWDSTACSSFRAYIVGDAGALATGTSSIDATASLGSHDGYITIRFEGTSSAGLGTTVDRAAYVDRSALLTEVAGVDGQIIDFDCGRILFVSDGGMFRLLDRGSGTATDLGVAGSSPLGALTSKGAMLSADGAYSGGPRGEWRDGKLVPLVPPGATLVMANGDFAVLSNGDSLLYDVVAGTSHVIVKSVDPRTDAYPKGMADNGDVITANTGTDTFLNRIRKGGADWSDDVGYLAPVRFSTDGINLAYDRSKQPVVYDDKGVTSVLGSGCTGVSWDCVRLATAGGWIAFTGTDATRVVQTYRRSPAGAISLASIWTTETFPEEIAPTGDIMLTQDPFSASPARYLARLGVVLPTRISPSSLGRVIYKDGGWYIVWGASLISVGSVASAGCGVSETGTDGGASEAGVTDSGVDSSDVPDADATVIDSTMVDGTRADAAADAGDEVDGVDDATVIDSTAVDGVGADVGDDGDTAGATTFDASPEVTAPDGDETSVDAAVDSSTDDAVLLDSAIDTTTTRDDDAAAGTAAPPSDGGSGGCTIALHADHEDFGAIIAIVVGLGLVTGRRRLRHQAPNDNGR